MFEDEDDGDYKEFHAQEEEVGDTKSSSRSRSGVVEPPEGRPVRTATPPYVPSEQERRAHNVTHFPPRSWCEHCVRGRGLASKHVRGDGEQI